MSAELYVLIGAVLGGLIGLASSFFTALLNQRQETRRRRAERNWFLEDQERKTRNDILNRRYNEAEALITAVMEEILNTGGIIYSAAKSKSPKIKRQKLNQLFQLWDHWKQIDEFEQLHTIVHAIGDSELINSVINLQITYNAFMDWIDYSLVSELQLDDSRTIPKRKLNKVDDFKMEAFEHYAHFYRRLDLLRSGISPEKYPLESREPPG